ncbi:hypothetical protein O181_007755 [Austropuccinia psidii MF-1]|uniref:Uncharacterized protein n=1 Tax=Austropuccinia psidii MF-1 TaxID=1389203 RepID=A0A9Q3GI80_9BASI|nr:hypothetical protein [Austropuccinia psidii MF-1]
MTICMYNAQHPLIIDSGAHCSIVARNYLDHHFPNWEKQLFPTMEKSFKSASGKITSIVAIIKEIIIPHRQGNFRLNPEFFVLEDAPIQGFLLETDYQRMYGIDIYNSKNMHITICKKKENKCSLYIYQFTEDAEENRPAFAIGEEKLGKIRGHDIELYVDVEIPYPPILRRPQYQESLETGKEIDKNINELLEMDVIRKIGHNEIAEMILL